MVKAIVLLTLVMLTLVLVLTTGCGPMEKSQQPSSQPTSAPQQVSVDASYSGKQIVLAVDGTLTVTLESNPSTGFRWELTGIADPTVLAMAESNYESTQAPGQTEPLIGAGGKETWTFNALKAGTTTFSMSYQRPQQANTSATKTFQLAVIVK